jgi:hypothetical protein
MFDESGQRSSPIATSPNVWGDFDGANHWEMSLPQALKKWQAYEGRSNMESSSSSLLPSLDNTQTSIPTRPYGFAESFTSADGR